jgi:hypothetical protein
MGVVRLTHKYAEAIDGVDLRDHRVGDIVNLSADQEKLLIAEGWAEPFLERRSRTARRNLMRRPDASRRR